MRLMSFALTTEQVLNGFRAARGEALPPGAVIKTETRRLGWATLCIGEHLWAVDRVMGFRPGQHPTRFGVIEVVGLRPEPIGAITAAEVSAEGFPDWTPAQFVDFFCRSMRVAPDRIVNRIKFRYLETPPCPSPTS